MKTLTLKAKSFEEAVKLGLEELKTTKDAVDIEILEEKKAGFLNLLGDTYVKIKMSLKDPKIDLSDLLQDVKWKVEHLLKLMNLKLDIKATVFGGRILIKLYGDDRKFLIGRSGDILDAFDMIVNWIVAKEQKNNIKIDIDVDNYKEQRKIQIEEMLEHVTKKILETGKPYKLRPMNNRDRRIIHLILDSSKDFYSQSEGEGRDRCIVVYKKS